MLTQKTRIRDLLRIWRKNKSRIAVRASLVLTVIVLYVASTIYNVRTEHALILGDIERITRVTTKSAELHTKAIFDATVHTLQALRSDIGRSVESDRTQRLLDSHFFGSPYLRTIIVLDSSGTNIASNLRELVGADGGGYQFFKVHQESEISEVFTGDIIVGRVSQSAHFVSSIPIRDDQRQLLGVLAAAYELDYFRDLYEQLVPDMYYAAALYHADEGLVVASDSVITEGSLPRLSSYPLHLGSYESAFRQISLPSDPATSILTYSSSIGDGKFYLATFADTDRLLANHYRSNRIKYLLAGLFVITVLCLMAVVEFHSARRRLSEIENTKLEGDLRRAQKLEALGTLAGGFAHDFNNLLSSIIGFAEIARERTQADRSPDNAISQVLLAGRRAEAMVERVLAFSQRSESNTIRFEMVPILIESLELAQIGVPATTEIRTRIEVEESWVFGDPSQMHQLITNLCVNAIHAMPEGGLLEIAIRRVVIDSRQAAVRGLLQSGAYLTLSIRDSGVGISQDVQERMFDPFYTTKQHGKGSGLGLSIVHSIIEDYQGAIEVNSAVGEGTEFVVWLPQATRPDSGVTLQDSSIDIDGEGRIAMFVDDDEAIVQLAEERLASFGFDPRAFTDSDEAIDYFEPNAKQVSLLVTDYAMPKLSGIDLAKKVRKLRPDLPIIIITGFPTKEIVKNAAELGNCELIRKPLRARKLAFAIHRSLSR